MEVFKTRCAVQNKIKQLKTTETSIGFVPTMGTLHKGHTSLIDKAVSENSIIVVSIFINPTQFNDPDDLKKYPRNLEKDLQLLQEQNVDIVFAPEEKEMYPEDDQRIFDLHPLDSVMEGKYRNNHFNGVAQIVSKLFEIITPDRAYFGQKDFQQLIIINRLVSIMGYNILIIPCPIIREPDGLAMSSRNKMLTPEERRIAPFIFETLKNARKLKNSYSPEAIENWVIETFKSNRNFRLEYFEIVDDKELRRVNNWLGPLNKVGCIAVQLGKIRLIDNIIFD